MKRKSLYQKLLAGSLTAALSAGLLMTPQAEEAVLEIEVVTEAAPSGTPAPEQDVLLIEDVTLEDTPEATIQEVVPGVNDAAPGASQGTQDSGFVIEEIVELEVVQGSEDPVVEETELTAESSGEAEDAVLARPKHVSVHDPSVFRDEDGTYYVLGSHTASAKSSDLIQWTLINSDYGNTSNTPFYGNLQEMLTKPFRWAGFDDGDCAGNGYAIWAPDVIWNPYYAWEDGSTGAYMLYCCTSSTWRRSCISYLVAKDFNGPYSFGDTIVYSGFTENGKPDGKSSRNTRWDNDYLNLNELLEKGSENGGIDEISDKWFNANGDWDHTYAPNAIDPNLFFDADGTRLYMSYGSWSGGMFLLELDPTTGEAIYPGVDSIDEVSGNYVDRYFGVHLIGANHQSGEGPYIQYDPQTGYYYFYCTYGGLTAEGGYNMRLFRSENPTGPYLDAAGGNAADNGSGNDNYGIKLIGNYSLYNQIGKRAAGHNSALIDEDGSHYLVYHQRFDIKPQLEAHEVRVHQQFLNEDLWPVTAVYEYRGEQPAHYEDSQVAGSYEFINHGNKTNGEMLDTTMLTLNEDGTVEGAASGTWTKSDSGNGYDFVTLVLGDVTYKGFFFRQCKENADEVPVMTFSALGDDNTCIWGSKVDLTDDKMIAGMAAIAAAQMIPSATKESIELPTSLMGAEISWSSSEPEVMNDLGEVTPQAEDKRLKLTATVTCGEETASTVIRMTVRGASALICGYDFETVTEDGTVASVEGSSLAEAAILQGVGIIEDEERGNVLQVTNEPDAKGANYLRLPAGTMKNVTSSGYTVAMWTKIGAETFEHSALFEADSADNYPLTRIGANLIARINANSYSDVQGALLTTSGERDVWEHIVYTVDPFGIRVYLNGELVGEETKDLEACFRKNATGISQAKDAKIGSGNIWGDEDCRNALFDDVMIYSGILTAEEVKALYEE